MANFDSPWKEALDEYLELFMAFCFPAIHTQIDWGRGYESLENELQEIAPASEAGSRFVDKLFKVWRIDGQWIEQELTEITEISLITSVSSVFFCSNDVPLPGLADGPPAGIGPATPP